MPFYDRSPRILVTELNALAEGLEDADKSIELDPTFWKGYLHKGEVQFLMHNYEDAMTTYLDGLKYGPQKTTIYDGIKRYIPSPLLSLVISFWLSEVTFCPV